MRLFTWNESKNSWLVRERGVSFEEVVSAVNGEGLIEVIDNASPRYPNQRIFIVHIRKYIYLVPFVEDERTVFMKTIIPSRKANKRYLKGGDYYGKRKFEL